MNFKLLLSSVMLFVSMAIHAAGTCLIVEMKDSNKFSFLLAEKPVITFQNGDLVVNGSSSTSYAISNVKNYHFEEKISSSVGVAAEKELRIVYLDENSIQVQNAEANAQVTVFNVAGVVFSNQYADAEGTAIVQLPSQKGIYIVKVGSQSFKVIRK